MIDTRIEIPPERSSKSDCVIRAISAASGCSYRDILAAIGPEKRRGGGYRASEYHPVLKTLGFERCGHTGLLDMACLDKKRRYVAIVRKHAVAIVRGVAVDTWHSTGLKRRRKLLELWIAP